MRYCLPSRKKCTQFWTAPYIQNASNWVVILETLIFRSIAWTVTFQLSKVPSTSALKPLYGRLRMNRHSEIHSDKVSLFNEENLWKLVANKSKKPFSYLVDKKCCALTKSVFNSQQSKIVAVGATFSPLLSTCLTFLDSL